MYFLCRNNNRDRIICIGESCKRLMETRFNFIVESKSNEIQTILQELQSNDRIHELHVMIHNKDTTHYTVGIAVIEDSKNPVFVQTQWLSTIVPDIESFYTFLINGLEKCIEKKYKIVHVKTNFHIGYNQLFGKWKFTTKHVTELFEEAKQVILDFDTIHSTLLEIPSCDVLTDMLNKTSQSHPSFLMST